VKLQPKAVRMRSTDEVYGSLAYDGAPLLHVQNCLALARFFLLFHSDEILLSGLGTEK